MEEKHSFPSIALEFYMCSLGKGTHSASLSEAEFITLFENVSGP